MDSKAFIERVRGVPQGEPLMLKFVLNHRGLGGLMWLKANYCTGGNNKVTIVADDKATVDTVILHRNWGLADTARDANRSIRFIGLDSLPDDKLTELARDVEEVG